MEAAVKALDEQKIELEKVILALKQEEAEEEALVAEDASVNDTGVGVDAADGDAAGNEVGEEGVLFIVQSSMSSTFKSSPCACSPERVACIKRSKPKNWILHKPPWPISFGTHHSKAMFLIYPRGEHIFDTSTESNDDGRALNYGNNGGD
ncbi:hypothetical protein P8452_61166 [Trifolium repens]|nr:hypothetical protein P8452_61166 [Trifolium repens]